ncbi:hypothetical protein [Paraburkholderia sp. WC7.3g]|uniref:hypothetical protein n=1 Tax=Paraburkholderia sp. WC7.3g TaxID=2991070 RepID=UPI003D1980C3
MAASSIRCVSLNALAGGAHRQPANPLRTRHKRLNRFSILHAIWLLGLSPVPTLAQQTVTERPNLSGSETINTIANGVLVVGTDGTSTNFSGTINNAGTASDPTSQQGQFVKTGAGTLTIDGATIRGGSAFVIGGGLAVTSSNAAIDYLSLGLGNAPTVPGSTSSGTLNVSGGTLTFNSALQVGDFGGTGTVTQTAGNVVFGTPGTPVSLNLGNQGGTGTYNLSGGTATFGNSATDFMTLGRNQLPKLGKQRAEQRHAQPERRHLQAGERRAVPRLEPRVDRRRRHWHDQPDRRDPCDRRRVETVSRGGRQRHV